MVSSIITKPFHRVPAGWITLVTVLLVAVLTVAKVSKWSSDDHFGSGNDSAFLEPTDEAQDFDPDPDVFLLLNSDPVCHDRSGYGSTAVEVRDHFVPESIKQGTVSDRGPPAIC